MEKNYYDSVFQNIIRSVIYEKNENLLDDIEYYKTFNPFALLKIFSTDERLLPYCEYFNRILKRNTDRNSILNKKDIYKMFLKIFPKFHKSTRISYFKKEDIKDIYVKIQDYFSCSPRESFYYEQVMDSESKNYILENNKN